MRRATWWSRTIPRGCRGRAARTPPSPSRRRYHRLRSARSDRTSTAPIPSRRGSPEDTTADCPAARSSRHCRGKHRRCARIRTTPGARTRYRRCNAWSRRARRESRRNTCRCKRLHYLRHDPHRDRPTRYRHDLWSPRLRGPSRRRLPPTRRSPPTHPLTRPRPGYRCSRPFPRCSWSGHRLPASRPLRRRRCHPSQPSHLLPGSRFQATDPSCRHRRRRASRSLRRRGARGREGGRRRSTSASPAQEGCPSERHGIAHRPMASAAPACAEQDIVVSFSSGGAVHGPSRGPC